MTSGYITSDNLMLESGRVLTRENLDSMAERIFKYNSKRPLLETVRDKLMEYFNR